MQIRSTRSKRLGNYMLTLKVTLCSLKKRFLHMREHTPITASRIAYTVDITHRNAIDPLFRA